MAIAVPGVRRISPDTECNGNVLHYHDRLAPMCGFPLHWHTASQFCCQQYQADLGQIIWPIDRRFHPDETFVLHPALSLYIFNLLFNFDHSFISFKLVVMQTVMQQRYEIYRAFDDDMAC